jgi:AcrR family transcriptional regulator
MIMATRRNMVRPRETILDAATHLFGATGYTGTTMREIANAVGVLPGSLYVHIDSKESLLLDIVEDGIDRFLRAVKPVASMTGPADERMREAIKAHVRVVGESPERTLVVFHQWRFLTGRNRARVVKKRSQYEGLFSTIQQDGVETGVFSADLDARIAVLTVLGALNWTPEWFSPEGPAGADEVGDRLADALLSGLLTARP